MGLHLPVVLIPAIVGFEVHAAWQSLADLGRHGLAQAVLGMIAEHADAVHVGAQKHVVLEACEAADLIAHLHGRGLAHRLGERGEAGVGILALDVLARMEHGLIE